MKITGILLASGASKRFGSPKQLLPWRGKALINHVIDTILESDVEDLIVVLGYDNIKIAQRIKNHPTIVYNQNWESGKSEAIKCGLNNIRPETDAVIFFTIDQPFITIELINELIDAACNSTAVITATSCGGKSTVPMVFKKAAFQHLRGLVGEEGGKSLIKRFGFDTTYIEYQDKRILIDIDSEVDYQTALMADKEDNFNRAL